MSNGSGLDAGTVIGGDFKVERHLASGAMGAVYIVEQLSTGKRRALKLMSPEIANDDRARERFVLEARVGAQIESDHVVEVVTAGIDQLTGAPYLVMELLKGEELADQAYRSGPMPVTDVAEIFKQAGHALAQAHALGIVHRDIKPENLFIAESRREGVPFTVKILDFGIAKLVAERTAEGTQPIGTPLFMAPEQTDRRGQISAASDVWPLGLIAFVLLTGRHYWQCADESMTQLLREVVMEPLVPASERAAQYGVAELLPPGFDAWFQGCVNRDPTQRYPDGGTCAQAFYAMVHGEAAQYTQAVVVRTGQAPQGSTTGMGTLTASATVLAQPALTVTESGAGSGGASKAIILGGLLVASVVGAGGYFLLLRDQDETSGPSQLTTASPVVSAAAAPPESCPDGMVLIEGGNMFMGSTDTDLQDDVRPPHRVTVSAFCLDKHEVTVAQYQHCSGRGNCLRAPTKVSFAKASDAMIEHYSTLCNAEQQDKADHPINCVDWSMANAFCEAEGGRLPSGGARLPSEAEWEFAARGSSQRVYPWGDDAPGPTRLNACGAECVKWHESVSLDSHGQMFEGDDGYAATAPVGSFEDGQSSAAVFDLAGNVWEWTADWYGAYTADAQKDPTGAPSGESRVVRGGGFNGMRPAWAKPAYRWRTAPASRSHGIGFRCAKSIDR